MLSQHPHAHPHPQQQHIQWRRNTLRYRPPSGLDKHKCQFCLSKARGWTGRKVSLVIVPRCYTEVPSGAVGGVGSWLQLDAVDSRSRHDLRKYAPSWIAASLRWFRTFVACLVSTHLAASLPTLFAWLSDPMGFSWGLASGLLLLSMAFGLPNRACPFVVVVFVWRTWRGITPSPSSQIQPATECFEGEYEGSWEEGGGGGGPPKTCWIGREGAPVAPSLRRRRAKREKKSWPVVLLYRLL